MHLSTSSVKHKIGEIQTSDGTSHNYSLAVYKKGYRRSGFDGEILMIANCEFNLTLQSKELQSILECVTITQYRVDYCNH